MSVIIPVMELLFVQPVRLIDLINLYNLVNFCNQSKHFCRKFGMMSSIYFWSLHSFCSNPFQCGKIDKVSVINASAIMFFNITFLLYYEKPFDTLILRIWVGFFFPKVKLCTNLQQGLSKGKSAYSHSVETWESLSSGERNNLPIINLHVPQGKSTAYGSSWRQTDVAKFQTLMHLGIACLSAHVFNFIISGMFSNVFFSQAVGWLPQSYEMERVYNMKKYF